MNFWKFFFDEELLQVYGETSKLFLKQEVIMSIKNFSKVSIKFQQKGTTHNPLWSIKEKVFDNLFCKTF